MPGKPWFFYTNTRCTQAALAEVHFGCIMCLYQFCSEWGHRLFNTILHGTPRARSWKLFKDEVD
jgi:hypothetical protein